MTVRRVLLAGLAGAVLVTGVASAQLTGAQQKCIDNYNNKLRLVSQQVGKSTTACIKLATEGGLPNPEACVVGDSDGKIADKTAKVADLFGPDKLCDPVPLVIVRPAAIANAAHVSAFSRLMHELFGNPVGIFSTEKTDAKCLNKAVQRATQALTEIVKQHRGCTRAGMKAGTVTSNASLLAACGTFSLLDAGGKAEARLKKLDADVQGACARPGINLAALFDGLPAACHETAAALSACLQAHTRCRACIAINYADSQSMSCDQFDDGLANGSCAPT